jgi:hypothetical protein
VVGYAASFLEKADTQLGQCFLVPIAVARNKRHGPCELPSVTLSVVPNNSPQGDSSEYNTIAARHLTSNDKALWLTPNGAHQVIEGFVAVNALLALIRRWTAKQRRAAVLLPRAEMDTPTASGCE